MYLGYGVCLYISIFLLMLSLIMFIFGLFFFCLNFMYFISWEIVEVQSLSVEMCILFDWMSLIFMSFVLLISGVVVGYSESYMSGDYNLVRFIILVFLFVISMMLLIISPNLISILLGWDGLGLVSYVLVIYYQNVKSYNAGMLVVLSNRVGDVMILMSIAWMLNFGSWNYLIYLNWVDVDVSFKVISWMLIVAGMTKSAQIPFSSWLPAAMAAPTPVSSLVHSSTLVTAGVYLLIRFSKVFLIENVIFLFLISGLTMFMAGMGAMFENDLKKIIALSTLSQLGLMMSTLSMGFVKFTFFHLLTHALFKALLFMCAGYMIHLFGGFQDVRYMGGLCNQAPFLLVLFNVSNLSLAGMPFLAGFYSKDLILEMVSMSNMNLLGYLLFFFSTGLTVGYSVRLFFCLSIGNLNSMSFHGLFDGDYLMMSNMVILVSFVLVGGVYMSWMIFPIPEMIFMSFYLSIMTIMVLVFGSLAGKNMVFYNNSFLSVDDFNYTNLLKWFLGLMWFMPILSTYGINKYFLEIGYYYMKVIDCGWGKKIGGQGLMSFFLYLGDKNEFFQNKMFNMYMIFMGYMFILIFFLIFILG
uniref:NADH-ubiquinone oxidoreductase chain 5 n=1 Tax=Neotrogla sp. 5 KY-2017 TaxID=2051645 RepID=A0A343QCB6_9NEOP|nr:NADH dehydrogenase subunit 5 [Neotrogla sp. 5 KY-2017]